MTLETPATAATTATVATVRGPVPVDQLGTTLMHEHVFVLTPDVMNNYGDAWWDEDERVADGSSRAACPARARRHPGADHHDAGRQPPPVLQRRGRRSSGKHRKHRKRGSVTR
jgi:hypothetical protein